MDNPFYNSHEVLNISHSGFLPHWNQDGKMQFVTFRLTDSLPQSKIKELSELKQRFINTHPLPWSYDIKMKYWKLISPLESKLLDKGYGSCILKDSAIRKVVSDSLKYWDGNKYNLVAYVIMPNHVHAIFHLFGQHTIESVIHSIKSYSSNTINKITMHSGSIWMKEYFDRIIRGEEHLNSCINYILVNPKYLKSDEFEVYVNPTYDIGRQDAATPL